MHKSGFVNIIGNTNVGKSTLMNQAVGERLSIITSKAQTTRHRILGIVNGEDFQIVYSDTPGMIKPKYKLQERMMSQVNTVFEDADVLVYVTDIKETADKNPDYIAKVQNFKGSVLLVINKIDLATEEQIQKVENVWKEILPDKEVFKISALNGDNVSNLFDRIIELLPVGPKWYPDDMLTDKTERFITSEIVRSNILELYQKEIPYSCEVGVESFKEDEKIIRIRAIIFVVRNSQKGIIIGAKGSAIKQLGIKSRENLEKFYDKQVYLELFVKVKKEWRNDDNFLRSFGY